jgi:hypothetical protein
VSGAAAAVRFAAEQPQVQVLGLAVDKSAPVQRFLQRQPLAFPVAMAGAGAPDADPGELQGATIHGLRLKGEVRQRKIGEFPAKICSIGQSPMADWRKRCRNVGN